MVLRDWVSTPETTVDISEKLAHMDTKTFTVFRHSLLMKKIFQPQFFMDHRNLKIKV